MTSFFFFFNDTATTEIYTLSLHDALPIYQIVISRNHAVPRCSQRTRSARVIWRPREGQRDRKSTRLNSSHTVISYAVFCLKKKKIHSIEIGDRRGRTDIQQRAQRQLGAIH